MSGRHQGSFFLGIIGVEKATNAFLRCQGLFAQKRIVSQCPLGVSGKVNCILEKYIFRPLLLLNGNFMVCLSVSFSWQV